ncbi:MAG: alpha/beta fold hydrolase [Proteobacteria bacterium]|nr:MAG: alpha/beta fold hydrolase [Pseudomonadota bacterium]
MTDKNWAETLEAHDGIELYCQFYPSPNPIGVLLTVHEYGQHSGAYEKAHERLVQEGYNIYTLDLRGHGKSPGERADISHFDDYLDDIDLLYARMQDREGNRPLFLLGQGMGSLVALRYALTRKPRIHGLILCGGLPELPMNSKERLLAHYAALFLSKIEANSDARELLLAPSLSGPLKDDALAFRGAVKAKTVWELNTVRDSLSGITPFLNYPVLCLSSEVHLAAMERLNDNLLSHDKTLIPYPGTSHQPFLGQERNEVTDAIVQWCGQHLERIEIDEKWDNEEEEDDSL